MEGMTADGIVNEGFVSGDYTRGIPYLHGRFESCAADVPQIYRTGAGFSTERDPNFVEQPATLQFPLTRVAPDGTILHRTPCDASLANAINLHPDIYANYTSLRPQYTYISNIEDTNTGLLAGSTPDFRNMMKQVLIDGCRRSIPEKIQADIDRVENIITRSCGENDYTMYDVLSVAAPITRNIRSTTTPENGFKLLDPKTFAYKRDNPLPQINLGQTNTIMNDFMVKMSQNPTCDNVRLNLSKISQADSTKFFTDRNAGKTPEQIQNDKIWKTMMLLNTTSETPTGIPSGTTSTGTIELADPNQPLAEGFTGSVTQQNRPVYDTFWSFAEFDSGFNSRRPLVASQQFVNQPII